MTVQPRGFKIYLAQTESGSFLAATNTPPYFCFEAESREALIEKVKSALVFFFVESTDREALKPSVSTAVVTRPFRPISVISSDELEYVA